MVIIPNHFFRKKMVHNKVRTVSAIRAWHLDELGCQRLDSTHPPDLDTGCAELITIDLHEKVAMFRIWRYHKHTNKLETLPWGYLFKSETLATRSYT